MPPKRKKSCTPAAAPAAAPAPAQGPQDANELDQLPPDRSYESLDEADGPPRNVMDEEGLIGVPDNAHAEKPSAPPAAPAAAPAMANVSVVLPAGAADGQALQVTTPDNQTISFTVPAGAQAGQQIVLQYQPTPAPPNPTAAAPAPAAGARKATGAKDAAKQLTAAQQRAKAEDAKTKVEGDRRQCA